MSIEQITKDRFYITADTPFPFSCPNCECIIPVASLDGMHKGVDRTAITIKCWACGYEDETCYFDSEWKFVPKQ